MTSEIPKMPEVHTLRRHEATQTLREWGRDLAARLEASNALCAELAEALEATLPLETFWGDYGMAKSIAEQRPISAALTRYKEATR